MKTFFLKFRLKHCLKNAKKIRSSVNFRESKRIGILVDGLDGDNIEAANHLVTQLRNEGKNIDTLCYTDKASHPVTGFPYNVFTRKDITLGGKFKSPAVTDFLNTEFDYIFSLTSNSILAIENILANCSAKCRVGFTHEDKKDLFEIMIKPASAAITTASVADMLFYLKKINV